MNQWKKILATCLTAGMLLGAMPTTAWAAAAQVIVEPSFVYGQVYNFDANNTTQVQDSEWNPMTVTASDTGLAASPAGGTQLHSFYDEAAGKYGYKDNNDKVVIAPTYEDYNTYTADDSTPLILVKKDGKWGAINKAGKTVAPFQYDSLYNCYGTDGKYFEVRSGESWGVMDATGKLVVPTVYDYINSYDELSGGVPAFWADQSGARVLVSGVTGQTLFTVPQGLYVNGSFNGAKLVPVTDSATYKDGYLDAAGNQGVPCIFDEAEAFVGDLTLVGMEVGENGNAKYAVMNSSGVLLTEYIYDYPYGIYGGEGLIAVRQDGEWGFVDATGTLVIPCQYESVGDFVNGVAVVGTYEEGVGSRYGLIDATGGIALPIQYSNIGASYDDYDGVSDYLWIAQQIEYTSYYGLAKIDRNAAAAPAPVVTAPAVTATPTSYPVILDGETVAFDVYALKDENGNDTNYFKLRDVAFKLNGTPAQFNVGWDGSVTVTTGTAYQANGSEMSAPFTGPQTVSDVKTTTLVNGTQAALETITLMDETGNGYTYYKLRDLGDACGFVVDWDAAAGAIVINTK